MIRTIIVDDEPRARESLRLILNKFFPDFDIVGEASGVEEAFNVITKEKPKVVFLDIKMPDGSGFDLLKKFQQIDFRVIFVTAFEEYALDAIKFSAFDYILKPVNTNEIRETIAKLNIDLNQNDDIVLKMKAFFENMEGKQNQKKIVLKTAESIHLVALSSIVRCESDCNYTRVYFDNQPKILISKSLKYFEDLLTNYGFIRVHQSHLVNLNFVSRIDKVDGGVLVFYDGTQVPVSVRKREQLFKLIEKM